MMLSLENNAAVRDNLDIGFLAWGQVNTTRYVVPLQGAVPVAAAGGAQKYKQLREQLLWVNRADPNYSDGDDGATMFGGTHTRYGVTSASRRLFRPSWSHPGGLGAGTATQDYQRRIIVLMTDGVPNPVDTTIDDDVRNMFGNNAPGGCPSPQTNECHQITMFTIGLLGPDDAFLSTMANNTPEGQYFPVRNIASLNTITQSLAYKIQLLTLQASAGRYGY